MFDSEGEREAVVGSRWEWLDFREEDQQRIRELISADPDTDTTDPLRLGAAVRDHIAEVLWPGTSTLHRRLRYVFFTPAILHSRPRLTAELVAGREADWNGRIAGHNPGVTGVFGRRERSTRFVPAYWSALRTWGFFSVTDPRAGTVGAALAAVRDKPTLDEENTTYSGTSLFQWHPDAAHLSQLLLGPTGRLADPDVRCTRAEAEFVLARWSALPHPRRPALAAYADFVRSHRAATDPWRTPVNRPLPVRERAVRNDLDSADRVGLICWSLQLAYNLELLAQARKAEARGADGSWSRYVGRLDETAAEIERFHTSWRRALTAEGNSLPPWIDETWWRDSGLVSPTAPPGTISTLAAAARRLVDGNENLRHSAWVSSVRGREALKGPAARLHSTTALASWPGRPEMLGRFDYRRSVVGRLLSDIEDAMHGQS